MEIGILSTTACVFALFIGLAMVMTISSIRIVPEYQRLVIFRLGRALGTSGPGTVFVLPIIDQPVTVDLRETRQEISHQSATTQDEIKVNYDLAVSWKVIDPMSSVTQIGNVRLDLQRVAVQLVGEVIGDMRLADVMAQHQNIVNAVRSKLEQAGERWGVKTTAVEIKITTPEGVAINSTPYINLIGLRGKVSQSLMPTGRVQIELDAVADELLTTGDEVVITEIKDSRLRVARATRP
jgi:regulator of protease activity HflC (stomatin/prohibitin superfamily)